MKKSPEAKQLSILDSDYLNYLIDQVIADPAKFPLVRKRMVKGQWKTLTVTEKYREWEIRQHFQTLNNDGL